MNREAHQKIVEGISSKRKEATFRSVMLIDIVSNGQNLCEIILQVQY